MRLLVFFVIVLGGCKSLPWNRSVPKLTFTSPTTGNKVEASGNAAEPAKVETKKATTEIPLPPNSQVSFVEAKKDLAGTVIESAKTVVTVPTGTTLKREEVSENVTQARAFAPATPSDLAKGEGVKWYYIAGAIFAVAAIVFLYLQHYKAAGFASLGAFLVPSLANLLGNQTAQFVGIGLAVLCLTLYAAWYLVKNNPEVKAEALSELQSLKLEYEKLKTQIPKI